VERIAFARKLVATTDRVFTFVTKPGDFAGFVRTRVVPLVAPTLVRIPAVRRFMFRTVSQTAITYRDSALSEGSVGDLHGGDRLPWVQLSPDRDNFETLTALAWQAHVYGEPRPGVAEICEGLNLPLHSFTWAAAMDRAGFIRDAIYVIRPDGYIGMSDQGTQPGRLSDYFRRRGIAPTSPA
jgi:hypothetical protein